MFRQPTLQEQKWSTFIVLTRYDFCSAIYVKNTIFFRTDCCHSYRKQAFRQTLFLWLQVVVGLHALG